MASTAAGREEGETQKPKCIPTQLPEEACGTPAKPLSVARIQTRRLIPPPPPPPAVQCGVIENAHIRLSLLLYFVHVPGRQRIENTATVF